MSSFEKSGIFHSVLERVAFPNKEINCDLKNFNFSEYKNLKFYQTNKKYKKKQCFIFMHGNMGCVDNNMASFLNNLSFKLKANIFAPEYPGYGISSNEKTTTKKIRNTLDLMIEYLNLISEDRNIYFLCHSIGTGITVDYVSRIKKYFGGIILLNPFKSIIKVAFDKFSIPFFDFYKTHKNINKVNCPVCLIHGQEDKLIINSHSKELFKLLNPEYHNCIYILEGVGHNNILYAKNLPKIINNFLKEKCI